MVGTYGIGAYTILDAIKKHLGIEVGGRPRPPWFVAAPEPSGRDHQGWAFPSDGGRVPRRLLQRPHDADRWTHLQRRLLRRSNGQWGFGTRSKLTSLLSPSLPSPSSRNCARVRLLLPARRMAGRDRLVLSARPFSSASPTLRIAVT